MTTEYIQLKTPLGMTLKDVVAELQKSHAEGIPTKVDFNGHTFYSDTVTLDDAYLQVTGKTFDEFEAMQKATTEHIHRQNERHQANIPQLTQEWIETGEKILSKDKHPLWREIVPIRLRDLYQGMELGATLEVVEFLNDEGSFEEAKDILDGQDHSGTSYYLTLSCIKIFADRGDEFYDYVKEETT